MSRAVCRSCGAEVIWVKTPRDQNIPLDVEQVPGGNIELRAGLAFVVPAEEGVRRYLSHFATCPNADKHRQRRQRRQAPSPPPPFVRQKLEQLKRKRDT